MKKLRHILILSFAIAADLIFVQCNKMDVGYLKAENGVYDPDVVQVYRKLSPEDLHVAEKVPWTSGRIQGIAGTNPIHFEIYDVKASEGGDSELFRKLIPEGEVRVQGSILQLFQTGVDKVPNGVYTLTVRVYNEDHSHILNDAFSFDIQDEEVFE